MASTMCLNCGETIILGPKPKLGYFYTCKSCRSEFELVWLNPIELDWPYEFEDDEEDGADGDYDYELDYDGYDRYEDVGNP